MCVDQSGQAGVVRKVDDLIAGRRGDALANFLDSITLNCDYHVVLHLPVFRLDQRAATQDTSDHWNFGVLGHLSGRNPRERGDG